MTAARSLAACLAASLASAASAAPPDARLKLAVLDFQAPPSGASLASAAGGVVANELDRIGVFKVVSGDQIRALLALERQKQILGCTEGGCLTEIGGALGVDYLVSGRVSIIGGGASPVTFSIDLTLSSVRLASREGSAIESARTESELMQRLPRAVGRLTAKILASRSGKLLVLVSEPGALVKVDDQVKGTTPLPGPLEISSGARALAVEKQGFVGWQADVTIQPGKMSEERVTLVPSPDFIQQYESRARKMRLGAWVATGVAAAGAATAVAFQLRANQLYGDSTTSGTFLYYKQKILDGAPPPPGVDYAAEAQRLKGRVTTAQNLSYVGAALFAVGGGIATWLWVAGDDPGRYSHLHTASLAPVPVAGGAALALAGRF